MITPAERVVQAVEQHYDIIPSIAVADAEAALTGALGELTTSLGWCPDCWGRGYQVNAREDGTGVAVACTCERGLKLRKALDDNLFTA